MDRPNDADMANKYQRDAAYWQEMAGKLAEALGEVTRPIPAEFAHNGTAERGNICRAYKAGAFDLARIVAAAALAEYNAAKP